MTGQGRTTCTVTLGADERTRLQETIDSGKGSKERRRRAHILLLADTNRPGGGRRDAGIADVPGVGTATVERVRKQCVLDGLEAALERKVQVNRKQRLLDGAGEATLTIPACSAPPEGRAQWTLQLPADRLAALAVVETVRRTPEKTVSSPG